MDFDIFGRNFTDEVGNQKALYYATSNNLCFCTTWQIEETRKSHFFTQMLISAWLEFNQSLFDFFNLFDSRPILTQLYDSVNLVINAFSSGLLEAWFGRMKVESAANWTVLHAQCMCPSALSS